MGLGNEFGGLGVKTGMANSTCDANGKSYRSRARSGVISGCIGVGSGKGALAHPQYLAA